jgi:dihydropteroate synthase-like protein
MAGTKERILFVTGRLGEPLTRRIVQEVAERVGFDATVQVVGISVAALMHVDWLARKLHIDEAYDRVILPGWVQGDRNRLHEQFRVSFELGPKDILQLPEYFGIGQAKPVDWSQYDVEILAEINHAPRLDRQALLSLADHYRDCGADVIDVGCIPGESWSEIGPAIKALREAGHRVSVDSFDRREVEAAIEAGAELVLSANSSNIAWASQTQADWVLIPDDPSSPSQLDALAATMTEAGRLFRADPILEPIGFGFGRSLERYYQVRRAHPDWPMMMGIGNVTEMSEVDSAGVNFLLAAICQELMIGSVLTTEVANWSRSSVKEFDIARRLAKFAIDSRRLIKRVDSPLLVTRADKLRPLGAETLAQMSRQITDPNFRIFVESGEIHMLNRDGYWRGVDPFELFDRFSKETQLDVSHAFYLGYELSKAVTALKLSKQYTQDDPLRWGFLSWSEPSAHDRRREQAARDKAARTEPEKT